MTLYRPTLRVLSLLSAYLALPACGGVDAETELADSSEQELLSAPGADLRVSAFSQTTQTNVDGFQQFSVTVKNFGSADSDPTTLTITLLQTQTAPQSYLLGSLQSLPSGCTLSGRVLTCALGRLRYNGPQNARQRTVSFAYKIPVTTQPLVLAAATSGIGEPPANATDNSASLIAAVNYRAVPVTAGIKTASHCTGTSLTAYYECTLFPSSIASHQAEYHGDGTITFPGEPSYSGTWNQSDATRLHFEYSNGLFVEAIFDGRGADGSCFEGITHFFEDPNPGDTIPPVQSSYVAPYRVCF